MEEIIPLSAVPVVEFLISIDTQMFEAHFFEHVFYNLDVAG
jgi:hypothetical protein